MKNIYETERPPVANSAPADSFGYLKITVATAARALPLVGAEVSVFGGVGRAQQLMAVLQTGESGMTDQISLPAPFAANSLQPDRLNPYNVFYVRIVAADFITRERIPVQIFPGILSDLIINLQAAAA